MTVPDQTPPPEPAAGEPQLVAAATEEKAPAEDPAAAQTLAEGDGEKEPTAEANGDPSSGEVAAPSAAGEESSEKALERASELFEKGSKAVEDGDFVEAADCLSQALEIRVAHYGELAPECVLTYYKYGCALLYKSQEESDPLVDVPKNVRRNTEKDKTLTTAQEGEPANDADQEASDSKDQDASDSKDQDASDSKEVEDASKDKDEEDDAGSDDAESAEEDADEDESDLDLAWKMLEVARAIVDKSPEDTMEKVNIFAALGEVSAEREEIETSLNDFLKALSVLERVVEPDNRRMVELNFRICLILEMGSKTEEAIPYCEKAISLCKSRLQRLKEDSANLATEPENNVNPVPKEDSANLAPEPENNVNPVIDPVERVDQSSGNSTSASSKKEDEAGMFRDILNELEKKLEDLQQVAFEPNSVFSDVLKMMQTKAASKVAHIKDNSSSSSSQTAASAFDSPTISTTATNGAVTHLGVVGRGIKRANVNPSDAEPSPKKPLLDKSTEKDEKGVSEVTGSTAQDAENANE